MTDFNRIAMRLKAIGDELDLLATEFDESGESCEHCGSVRYNFWLQRLVRKRIEGAAARMNEISESITRQSTRPEWSVPGLWYQAGERH